MSSSSTNKPSGPASPDNYWTEVCPLIREPGIYDDDDINCLLLGVANVLDETSDPCALHVAEHRTGLADAGVLTELEDVLYCAALHRANQTTATALRILNRLVRDHSPATTTTTTTTPPITTTTPEDALLDAVEGEVKRTVDTALRLVEILLRAREKGGDKVVLDPALKAETVALLEQSDIQRGYFQHFCRLAREGGEVARERLFEGLQLYLDEAQSWSEVK